MNLSIIIPHFNGAHLLETLLASIPNDKEIQTIVVDDKSDLSHLKVIEKFKSSYNFEFYHNDGTKSAGACRNIGLEKAKGKWIMFADSDDYFVDGFYTIVSKYFHKNNDVVFFSPTSQYIDTKKLANRHHSFQKIIYEYIKNKSKKNEFSLRYRFIVPWSRMIKKEFIDNNNIKFDEILTSNDVMFITKVGYFMKSFNVSTDVVYCITKRYGSLTTTLNEDFFDLRLNTRVSRINFLKRNVSKEEFRNIMRPYICNMASQLLLRAFILFGYKKFLEVYNLYKKENIKWFRAVYLNPIKVIQFTYTGFSKYMKNKKYNKS